MCEKKLDKSILNPQILHFQQFSIVGFSAGVNSDLGVWNHGQLSCSDLKYCRKDQPHEQCHDSGIQGMPHYNLVAWNHDIDMVSYIGILHL